MILSGGLLFFFTSSVNIWKNTNTKVANVTFAFKKRFANFHKLYKRQPNAKRKYLFTSSRVVVFILTSSVTLQLVSIPYLHL